MHLYNFILCTINAESANDDITFTPREGITATGDIYSQTRSRLANYG